MQNFIALASRLFVACTDIHFVTASAFVAISNARVIAVRIGGAKTLALSADAELMLPQSGFDQYNA